MAAEPSPAAERTADGVRRMFDRVAPRYDLANTVFSMGQDRAWRQAAARAAGLVGGQTAVDVACGTGALTRELAASAPGAAVLGVDFSWEMVRRAAAAPGPVAAYLHARATAGWRGRRAAWLSLLGLAALLFNFYAVNTWIVGLHSYAR